MPVFGTPREVAVPGRVAIPTSTQLASPPRHSCGQSTRRAPSRKKETEMKIHRAWSPVTAWCGPRGSRLRRAGGGGPIRSLRYGTATVFQRRSVRHAADPDPNLSADAAALFGRAASRLHRGAAKPLRHRWAADPEHRNIPQTASRPKYPSVARKTNENAAGSPRRAVLRCPTANRCRLPANPR